MAQTFTYRPLSLTTDYHTAYPLATMADLPFSELFLCIYLSRTPIIVPESRESLGKKIIFGIIMAKNGPSVI